MGSATLRPTSLLCAAQRKAWQTRVQLTTSIKPMNVMVKVSALENSESSLKFGAGDLARFLGKFLLGFP